MGSSTPGRARTQFGTAAPELAEADALGAELGSTDVVVALESNSKSKGLP